MVKYQQEGNTGGKPYYDINVKYLSLYQNELYKRALYGINFYSKEEQAKMHWDKKRRIKKLNKRAQLILNRYKQLITIKQVNLLFETFFPKSPITQELLSESLSGTDDELINNLSFKDLGLTKSKIIAIFMHEKILPDNFLELKKAP